MGKARRIPRKARNVPVTVRSAPWDMGATGPANQIGLVDQERGEVDLATGKVINPNRVFGKVRMPVFMRMMKQNRITPEHAASAQRLYAAWAGHPTRDPIAAISDRVDRSGTTDPNVIMVDRRREFRTLWAMVPDDCKPVVEHVILDDLPIRAMRGASRPESAAEYLGRLTRGLEGVK
jgi:hypothetical protein